MFYTYYWICTSFSYIIFQNLNVLLNFFTLTEREVSLIWRVWNMSFFYHPSLQDNYLPICCLFVRVSQSDNLKQFKGWGFHSYPKLCLIEITFYDIIHSQKKKNCLKLSDEEKSVENSSTFSNSVIDLLPCLGLLSCCMTQFGQALAFEQIHIWL